MKGFSEEVRREVYEAQNCMCGAIGCLEHADSCHHRVHNTATNRKLYPRFIHSPFNAVYLCNKCHDSEAIQQFKIPYKVAAMYEKYLQEVT